MALSNDESLMWVIGKATVTSPPSLSEFVVDQTNETVSFQLENRMEFEEDKFPFQHTRPSGDPDWIYLLALDKGQFYIASFTQDCPPSPPSISSQSNNVGTIVGS